MEEETGPPARAVHRRDPVSPGSGRPSTAFSCGRCTQQRRGRAHRRSGLASRGFSRGPARKSPPHQSIFLRGENSTGASG